MIGQTYSLVIQREIHANFSYLKESASFLVSDERERRLNDYKTQQENSIKKSSLLATIIRRHDILLTGVIKFMVFLQI